ncbi:MAG: AEC family transporter [Dehalococcoidia bacterium]
MLRVFLEVVLPVALVAVISGLVGRWRQVPVPPVSALVFYLFSPALVFSSMATTHVPAGTSLRIVAVMVGTYAAMWVVSTAWSLVRRHDPSMRAAFALGATTPNVGNMGLPVAQLAFGDAGLQVAIVNFVAGATLTNTAGIAVAALAGNGSLWRRALPSGRPTSTRRSRGWQNVLGILLPAAIEAPAKTLAPRRCRRCWWSSGCAALGRWWGRHRGDGGGECAMRFP